MSILNFLLPNKKKSMAEVVRNWSLQGLNGDHNAQSIGLITDIVRTQLQDVLRPSIDRLATLNAKTCMSIGNSRLYSRRSHIMVCADV